jgi:hypothetical protein
MIILLICSRVIILNHENYYIAVVIAKILSALLYEYS